ncbi:hypothetical protein Nepgr_027366 [Nepenthes gracilis]|uniref:Uncharacterized protein n=1 Tax=Nepenthes gracilis TaxID=150966 RepID=A0AAD3TA95_NEPGR|nr:hypothetical protein Nepgr_027366 [Nepenthes gracilis]
MILPPPRLVFPAAFTLTKFFFGPWQRSTLLLLLEMGLVQWEDLICQRDEELSNRDQTLVDRNMLEEMEGRPNATLAEARGSQEEVASLRWELFVLSEERSRALNYNASLKNELQVAIRHLSELQS